ncbi:YraN family protein [Candidatus Kuenenbacteria bacterium]|nr:YraN family protein [Candidatus Kuenenbacteria bacterium]
MGLFSKKNNAIAPTKKRRIGNLGEKIAKNFFKKQGYKIIKQNFTNRMGEIDLIVKEKDQIVFVEVKTRTNQNFGYPEESIDSRKQSKIIRTALNYLFEKKIVSENYRFDVISIEVNQLTKKATIKHIKDAF